jgi:hypothetical protein
MLRRLRESHDRKLAHRGAAIIGAAAFRADLDRWKQVEEASGQVGTRRLMLKWNMDRFTYRPGDPPPRPRSLSEWTAMLGVLEEDTDAVREYDARMVETWEELVADSYFPELLCVPIDDAQGWWDSRYSQYVNADGTIKPAS